MTLIERAQHLLADAGPYYDANRDVIRQGKHYTRHVMAMTSERLHSKADIAQELAHRDQVIEQLLAENEKLRGITPEIGSRPPHWNGPEMQRAGMPRYGIRWNGPSQPLAVPMDDGYWTPWHMADAAAGSLQARIDALMLEHCPDEMTPEQIAEWERHQVPVRDAGPTPLRGRVTRRSE